MKKAVFALLTLALAAWAQDDPPTRAGRLNFVEGTVSLQPNGSDEWMAAPINRPLTTGDTLWTEAGARAELHSGGAVFRLRGSTNFSFLNLDDNVVQVRLTQGTLNVWLKRLDENESYEIDTPNVAISLLRPGEYRIDVNPEGDRTFVVVRRGEVEATGGGQAFPVRPGESADITGTDTLAYDVQPAPAPDGFDNWCRGRDQREERAVSARYVPPGMIGYEDLDGYGEWRRVDAYGMVWVPRVVVGWAPYHYGHWVWVAPWGWTWVDDAPWGFAPFHYGRWAMVAGVWGWIPGPVAVRPVYAPALVAWVGGRNWGVSLSIGGGAAVGWVPLGPGEVYVPTHHCSTAYVTNVNVTNTVVTRTTVINHYTTVINNTTNVTNITYVNQRVPGAVTAMRHEDFSRGRPVAQAAVAVSPQAAMQARVAAPAVVIPPRPARVIPTAAPRATAIPPAQLQNRAIVVKRQPPTIGSTQPNVKVVTPQPAHVRPVTPQPESVRPVTPQPAAVKPVTPQPAAHTAKPAEHKPPHKTEKPKSEK